jgi:hypothetical protein
MATVFLDARGISHIEYFQKGTKINGEYHTNLMGRFNKEIKKKDKIWPRKKFFSTRIMLGCTHVQFPWQKAMHWAIPSSLILPILQI